MLFAARGRSSVNLVANDAREVRDRGTAVAGALSALGIDFETLAAMAVACRGCRVLQLEIVQVSLN